MLAHERSIALSEQSGETFRKSFSLAGLGEQALAAGEHERAAELFAQSLRIKIELGDRMGIAVGLDSLGRVAVAQGDGRRAALLLGAAQSVWDAIGMRETRNAFASASSTSDGIQRTRRLLGKREFRIEFRRGSALSEDQAIALRARRRPGARRQHDSVGASPLTRRETEVADLVAHGLSNPEIAERLYISVRTAQGHVENILRKLGFNSRSKIAAWVAHRQARGEQPLSVVG